MNVILVMSDSFRRDHIGAFGNSWIKTPALDRFASQSTDFPNFRMGSYATIPQRTDMFTGHFSFHDRPWTALKPDDVVLAELLAKKGIATYCSADTPHLFHSGMVTFMRGFDAFHWSRGSEGDMWWSDFYNEQDYRPPTGKGRIRINPDRYKKLWSQGRRRTNELDWVTPQTFQAGIEWLTRNYRRDSFFLYIDTFDPHEPWDPPRWARDLYLPDAKGRPYAWAEYGSAKQYGKEELRHLQALYAGECTIVDRWFGRLMDTVDLLGLSKNTMVIFLADHGHYLGYPNDGGQIGKATGYRKSDGKMAYRDADVFVPLLDPISNPPFMVRMPGQDKSSTRNEIAQPPDVMPTVLEVMGVKRPRNLHGKSILPLLKDKTVPWRSTGITALHKNFIQITDKRWLYGVRPAPDRKRPKLYDRKTDPNQKRDVLKKNPGIARRLHRKLVSEMRSLKVPPDWIDAVDSKL